MRAIYRKSCAVEIKASAGNTIPASALLDHQRAALMDVASFRGIAHKLSDEARRQQPFDAFMLANVPAYVVACFTKAGVCYVIPIEIWKGARVGMQAPYMIDL